MSRVRSRRAKGLAGPDLSPSEELELVLGPHPDRGSVFPTSARRREAEAALVELQAIRANAGGLVAYAVDVAYGRGRQAWAYPDPTGRLRERAEGMLATAATFVATVRR